jgi:hypothetical protein
VIRILTVDRWVVHKSTSIQVVIIDALLLRSNLSVRVTHFEADDDHLLVTSVRDGHVGRWQHSAMSTLAVKGGDQQQQQQPQWTTCTSKFNMVCMQIFRAPPSGRRALGVRTALAGGKIVLFSSTWAATHTHTHTTHTHTEKC